MNADQYRHQVENVMKEEYASYEAKVVAQLETSVQSVVREKREAEHEITSVELALREQLRQGRLLLGVLSGKREELEKSFSARISTLKADTTAALRDKRDVLQRECDTMVTNRFGKGS
ncbi:hypothetical protein KIPB_000463 [Kipferlia bialata]|uniref:Uncharacterized protein n=1 Tax=Kipferlia bialata TaxID=797122 RepID=A0A9K3GEE8_9EUKA|nr:hypothetical protein KIPB_000463 [Kipferlia bialata]|eukprot:g463.t1